MFHWLRYMVDALPEEIGRRLVGGVVMIILAALVACSTTDEDPAEPWDEWLMNNICEEGTQGTSACDL